tara:strand:- start:65 stop:415 length:351 start_codon:yes stop_codon:yes gene_type:complete
MKKKPFVGLCLAALLCLQAVADAQTTSPITIPETPSITVQLPNGDIMFLDPWVQTYWPYIQSCLPQATANNDSSSGLFEQYKLLLGAAGAAALTAAQGYFTAKTRYTKKQNEEQTT